MQNLKSRLRIYCDIYFYLAPLPPAWAWPLAPFGLFVPIYSRRARAVHCVGHFPCDFPRFSLRFPPLETLSDCVDCVCLVLANCTSNRLSTRWHCCNWQFGRHGVCAIFALCCLTMHSMPLLIDKFPRQGCVYADNGNRNGNGVI